MAVFSKFAVSVAVVAVGYEGEHCETASALQIQVIKQIQQALQQGDKLPIIPNGVITASPSSNFEVDEVGLRKVFAGKPQEHKNAIQIKQLASASVPDGTVVTLERIMGFDEAKLEEVLKKIECDGKDGETMSTLLQKVKEEGFFTDVQEAIRFTHTLSTKYVKAGSSCALVKAIIQGLQKETEKSKKFLAEKETYTSVFELLSRKLGEAGAKEATEAKDGIVPKNDGCEEEEQKRRKAPLEVPQWKHNRFLLTFWVPIALFFCLFFGIAFGVSECTFADRQRAAQVELAARLERQQLHDLA